MDSVASIVIVGAGQAAAQAAACLRSLGYGGRIALVGREPHLPYERPPLSKAVLAAAHDAEPAVFVHPPAFFAKHAVDMRLGTEAVRLDRAGRQVMLADGTRLDYDRCLLATGGRARELPGLPAGHSVVHYLRTLDDALRLRAALAGCRRAAVIGGGFLGLEIASTLRAMGTEVALVESAPRLLSRGVPAVFSEWLQARAAHAGVTLHLGKAVAEVRLPDGPDATADIALADGSGIAAGLIVVAAGLAPETALARDAGLPLDPATGGIAVDDRCRSADPDVYAAGDCASLAGHDGGRLRLESWQAANEQARVAAAAMLGLSAEPAAHPWFWTDQFGCNIQMQGLPEPGLEYVLRGEADARGQAPRFVMLGLRGGVARHALAVNAAGELRALRPLLERAVPLNAADFADESLALRAYAKQALAAAAAAPA